MSRIELELERVSRLSLGRMSAGSAITKSGPRRICRQLGGSILPSNRLLMLKVVLMWKGEYFCCYGRRAWMFVNGQLKDFCMFVSVKQGYDVLFPRVRGVAR